MTGILGWTIFIIGLLCASAVVVLPLLYVLTRRLSERRPSLATTAAAVASGALALWFAIPAVVNAAFG